MPLYIWPPLCSLSCKRKEHKQDTLKIYIQGTNDNIHRTCIFKVLAGCDPCQVPSLAIDIPIISVLFFFIRYITDTSFNLSELLLAGNHMDERIGMNALFWTIHFQWFAWVESICILTYNSLPLGNKWSFHSSSIPPYQANSKYKQNFVNS